MNPYRLLSTQYLNDFLFDILGSLPYASGKYKYLVLQQMVLIRMELASR